MNRNLHSPEFKEQALRKLRQRGKPYSFAEVSARINHHVKQVQQMVEEIEARKALG